VLSEVAVTKGLQEVHYHNMVVINMAQAVALVEASAHLVKLPAFQIFLNIQAVSEGVSEVESDN
jgi:hypothetical protein